MQLIQSLVKIFDLPAYPKIAADAHCCDPKIAAAAHCCKLFNFVPKICTGCNRQAQVPQLFYMPERKSVCFDLIWYCRLSQAMFLQLPFWWHCLLNPSEMMLLLQCSAFHCCCCHPNPTHHRAKTCIWSNINSSLSSLVAMIIWGGGLDRNASTMAALSSSFTKVTM